MGKSGKRRGSVRRGASGKRAAGSLSLSVCATEGNCPARAAPRRGGPAAAATRRPATLEELLALTAEELAGVDVAAMNLLCATDLPGAERLDVDKCLAVLDAWAARVKAETDRHLYRFNRRPEDFDGSEGQFRMLMLVTVLQEDFAARYNADCVGSMDFTDSRDLFLHGLIGGDHAGTCTSMPVLYVAVARRLGYPLKLVLTHAQMAARGYLRSLTPAEELATFLATRGHCLLDTGRTAEARRAYEHAARLAPNDGAYRAWADEAKVHQRSAAPGSSAADAPASAGAHPAQAGQLGAIVSAMDPAGQDATGHFDAYTSMMGVLYRNYHPALGRWISRDPEGFADGMNRYEYVLSPPTGGVDPDGTARLRTIASGGPRRLEGRPYFMLDGKAYKARRPDSLAAFCGWYYGTQHQVSSECYYNAVDRFRDAEHARGYSVWVSSESPDAGLTNLLEKKRLADRLAGWMPQPMKGEMRVFCQLVAPEIGPDPNKAAACARKPWKEFWYSVVKVGPRRPMNYRYAARTFPAAQLPPDVARKYPNGIRFNEKGFPNFSPYAEKTVRVPGVTGNHSTDMKLANQIAGYPRTPPNYMWHHVEDGVTMELVPKDLHRAVYHTGGVAVMKHRP